MKPVSRILYIKILGQTYFLRFSCEAIFDLRRGKPEGVMISLGGTDESLLSDGTARLNIRTAIKQFPLLKSIFHLFRK